jgi:hypothetical protein
MRCAGRLWFDLDGRDPSGRGDLDLQTTNEIGTSDLSLDGVARAERHGHKLTNCAILRGNAIEPDLIRSNDVILDGLALGKKFVAADKSLLGIRGRLARHCIHATDVDLDSELLVGLEADPYRLALCACVSEDMIEVMRSTYDAWARSSPL